MPDYAETDAPPWLPTDGDGKIADNEVILEVNIGDGITSVGAYAFKGSKALEYVDNMSDVQTVGAYAFGGCDSLAAVAYHRTQSDWDQIGFADGNQKIRTKLPICSMIINAKVEDPATGRLRCRIDGGELSGPVRFVQETVMADCRV